MNNDLNFLRQFGQPKGEIMTWHCTNPNPKTILCSFPLALSAPAGILRTSIYFAKCAPLPLSASSYHRSNRDFASSCCDQAYLPRVSDLSQIGNLLYLILGLVPHWFFFVIAPNKLCQHLVVHCAELLRDTSEQLNIF